VKNANFVPPPVLFIILFIGLSLLEFFRVKTMVPFDEKLCHISSKTGISDFFFFSSKHRKRNKT